jgi:hypothetical protein
MSLIPMSCYWSRAESQELRGKTFFKYPFLPMSGFFEKNVEIRMRNEFANRDEIYLLF